MGRDIFVTNRWNDDHGIANLFRVAAITSHNSKNFGFALPGQVDYLHVIYTHVLVTIAATHQ